MWTWIGIAVCVALALFIALSGQLDTMVSNSTFTTASIVYYLIWLGVLAPILIGVFAGRSRRAFGEAAIWIGLCLLLIGGYSFRDTLSGFGYRIIGELAPPGTVLSVQPRTSGEISVRIRRQPSGHFAVRSTVEAATIPRLVDTGATTVVLSQRDARAIGIDTQRLSYTLPVKTANGTTFAAHVTLRSLAVGAIRINDIEALVAKPGALDDSLLGMNFLNRLRSYEFSGDFLTLRG